VADGLPAAVALLRELVDFRVTITIKANETFGAGTPRGTTTSGRPWHWQLEITEAGCWSALSRIESCAFSKSVALGEGSRREHANVGCARLGRALIGPNSDTYSTLGAGEFECLWPTDWYTQRQALPIPIVNRLMLSIPVLGREPMFRGVLHSVEGGP
jgi:hypothetical protein